MNPVQEFCHVVQAANRGASMKKAGWVSLRYQKMFVNPTSGKEGLEFTLGSRNCAQSSCIEHEMTKDARVPA